MARRAEFTGKVRKQALKRSGMKCEAIGKWYGLPAGTRCGADLAYGVEYDHIILDANSKDNSLENCAAVCIKCHRYKSARHDTPVAAKTVRQQNLGLKTKPKAKINSSGFPRKDRTPKARLPPRSFYRELDQNG